MSRTIFTFVAFASFVSCLIGTTVGDEFESVRRRIRSYVNDEGIPSVTVAAIRGPDIVWVEAFGWADVENRIPATSHTPYMLASASKPITATAVLVAVEKGYLELDCSLNQYLGASPIRSRLGDASKVTVQDVLMHRSGIPNHSEAYFLEEEYRPPKTEALIRNYGWTMMPYGEFHYSNLGYLLLSEAVSRATGDRFHSFVHQEVFGPLGMSDSTVRESATQPRAAAVRYGETGRLRDFSTTTAAAAEIYSSVSDLAHFATFHLDRGLRTTPKVLSAQTINEMQDCTTPIQFFGYEYGLGWSVGHDAKGRKHVFHGGGFAGCDSYLTLLPDQHVAVAFLSNKNRKWPGITVSQDIVERMLAVLVDDEPETFRINYDRLETQTAENVLDNVAGYWNGKVVVGDDDISISLRIDSDGNAYARLAEGMEARVENPRFIANAFFGITSGGLNLEASRCLKREQITWDLRLLDEKLTGVLYVSCQSEGDGYLLPYCTKLARRGEP